MHTEKETEKTQLEARQALVLLRAMWDSLENVYGSFEEHRAGNGSVKVELRLEGTPLHILAAIRAMANPKGLA